MITPSFSPTATERVLPKLAIDFTTASLDSRITFTRSENTATRINSSGNVELVNANTPRFDYTFGTGGACKGLLIEETRINSLRNNNGTGAVAGTPGTLPTGWYILANSNLSTAVIGTGTEKGVAYVDLRIYGTSSTTYYVLSMDSTQPGSSGQVWTTSMYASLVGGSLTNVNAVNTTSLQVGGAGGGVDVPMSLSATLTRQPASTVTLGTGATAIYPCFFVSVNASSAVDLTLRIGYPQLEQGAFATSVIPTGSGAVTRNADVATMTGTNFSSWFNASEGTFDVEGTIVGGAPATYPAVVAAIGANPDTDSIVIAWTANSGVMRAGVRAGGVTQADNAGGSSKTAGSTFKVASAYKTDSFQASFNGTLGTQDTSGSLPTVTSLTFCGPVTYQPRGNFIIKKLFYYPQRLINANVQSITYN